ncbi:MAG: sensor domain-containing diguanylate cyclase [Candidatus Hydrogenedentota bacterium]
MSQTLQATISSIFRDAGAHDFLFQIQQADVFDFICKEVVDRNAASDSQSLTLIMDPRTAVQTNTLIRLGHVAHIYVCGKSDSTVGTLPSHTELIDDAPVGLHDRLLIVLTPSASYLTMYSVDQQDFMNTAVNRGCWSFHRELIRRIAETLTAGATLQCPDPVSDAASYPVSTTSISILSKLASHIENQQHDAVTLKNDFALVLNILKHLSVKRSTHEILYVFTEQIASTIYADRCSVVRIWENDDEAHVLASHEDASVDDMVISLSKYPEISAVLETSTKVVINDVKTDPRTAAVSEQLEKMGITSILVVPIVLFNENVGSFLLRTYRMGGTFSQREVDFCSIVCEAAANAIERADLFEAVQKSNRSLERLATTDALTKLHNRRFFISRLEDEIARSVRYAVPMCCLLVDVDDFKSINDTYGHLVGDQVLKDVAARMLKTIRTNDVVARYGGEEFIILLPQTELNGAVIQSERLLKIVSAAPYSGLPEDVGITVSVGIAIHDTTDPITTDDLVKQADVALYRAKDAGKNRLVIYE